MSYVEDSKQESGNNFQRYDLVWSKLTGYPWWPGKILELPKQNSGKYKVQFIGDSTHAYLPANKLVEYQHGRDRYSHPPKSFKGFPAAKAEADKLFLSFQREEQVIRGDYSRVKTVPDQQIQIFNQEKSIFDSSIHQLQKQLNDQPDQKFTQKPKRLFKRYYRASSMPKTSKVIKKIQQHVDQQRLQTQLLQKYGLDKILQINQVEWPKKKAGRRKRKQVRKPQTSIDHKQVRIRLIRKLSTVLRRKGMKEMQNYRKIAIFLGNSLLQQRQKNVRGAHRALFQWLSANDYQTILNSYRDWSGKCQKAMTTGFTDLNQLSQSKYESIDEEQ